MPPANGWKATYEAKRKIWKPLTSAVERTSPMITYNLEFINC